MNYILDSALIRDSIAVKRHHKDSNFNKGKYLSVIQFRNSVHHHQCETWLYAGRHGAREETDSYTFCYSGNRK